MAATAQTNWAVQNGGLANAIFHKISIGKPQDWFLAQPKAGLPLNRAKEIRSSALDTPLGARAAGNCCGTKAAQSCHPGQCLSHFGGGAAESFGVPGCRVVWVQLSGSPELVPESAKWLVSPNQSQFNTLKTHAAGATNHFASYQTINVAIFALHVSNRQISMH